MEVSFQGKESSGLSLRALPSASVLLVLECRCDFRVLGPAVVSGDSLRTTKALDVIEKLKVRSGSCFGELQSQESNTLQIERREE